MRISACVIALLASFALPASAQTFVNLDFEQARLPDPRPDPLTSLAWSDAIPGWDHSDGDSTEHVHYLDGHVGFSQSYVLLDTSNSPFGAASGSFAVGMRNGTFREHEPRGDFTRTFLSQTGTVPSGAAILSLLSSSFRVQVSIDGTPISLRPVSLDPGSPSYGDDLLTYSGEWMGDVSAFAGDVVELKILNGYPPGGGATMLAIDQIRFLPIPEPSTPALLGLGLLALLGATRKSVSPFAVTSHR